jgi:hypothetical protein
MDDFSAIFDDQNEVINIPPFIPHLRGGRLLAEQVKREEDHTEHVAKRKLL